MNPEERELLQVNAAVGAEVHGEYWMRVGAILEGLGELPFEARTGIAQAVADVLGCRVVLQAAIMESVADDPNTFRIVGHRETMRADPTVSHAVYG